MKRFAIMAVFVVILSLGTTSTANAQRFRGGGGFAPPSRIVAGRPMPTMGAVRGFPQASSFVFPRSSFVVPRTPFVPPHFNTFNGLITPRRSVFNGFNSLNTFNSFNTLNGFNSFNRFNTFNNTLGLGMGLGLGFGGFGTFNMFNTGMFNTGISPLGGGFVVPFNPRSSFVP